MSVEGLPAARRLYDSLQTEADLAALIGQPEDLHLEVKECSAPPQEHMKGYVSQVLSGFANSDGGVLVLGMVARKEPDADTDVITRTQPFQGYVAVENEVLRLLHRATDPVVDGVEIRHVPSERDPSYGYVVMIVPASDGGPHRAVFKKVGDREYWKRAGDSFFKMEHYDIADMMGRRRRPKLVLVCRPYIAGTDPPLPNMLDRYHDLGFVLTLRNEGRSLARYPMLELHLSKPLGVSEYGLDGNRNHGLRRQALAHTSSAVRFVGDPGQVIYPGMDLDVTRIVGVRMHQGQGEWTFQPEPVTFRYRVAAEDQTLEERTFAATTADMIREIRPELGFGR